MKKRLIALIICILLLIPYGALAAPPDFCGGVNNEYKYEEYVFITGEPIKFVGTFDISEREKDDEETISYNFKLTPEDNSIDAKLDRKITLLTNYTKRSDKGQTIAQTELTKYKETLKIDKDKYVLDDFQLSKSDIIDNRPASDFYSGNMKGRKYYKINKDEGEVIVEITGGNVGYENFWGSTETEILDYHITSKRQMEEEDDEDIEEVNWSGTVQAQVSDSRTKVVKYSDNEANFSSFYGGHIRTTNQEMVSRYEYNLPRIKDEKPDDNRRNRGTVQLKKDMVPKLERLTIPKFKDIGGHWAEDSINKLYALDIFEEQSAFFLPDIVYSRAEFVKGIMRACNIRTSVTEEKKPKKRRKNTPPEQSPFWDVATSDANYLYIKDAFEKKIISGVYPNLFEPNKPLTKAQAITILIRALGFENKAPSPGFYTSFADDRKIPNWAKDNIYVAREIRLVSGDNYNRIHPDKYVTKAEAAAMLIRFLEFLQKDLQRDYRENIVNY
jgi:hypothetical protein